MDRVVTRMLFNYEKRNSFLSEFCNCCVLNLGDRDNDKTINRLHQKKNATVLKLNKDISIFN